jgi:multiple antibiotic resistance protein
MNMTIWLNAFLALFAILNPIGTIPIFSEITEDLDKKGRFAVFNVAVATAFGTLLVVPLIGQWVMNRVFQISILEFRIAGGILLTVISVKYIVFPDKKNPKKIEISSHQEAIELGIVPMAVPLLVGPGTIVTGILLLDRDGYLITVTAIVAVFIVSWVLIQLTPWISRLMGKIGRMVVSRILWIFMAALGVHFLLTGIQEMFGL